MARIGGFSDAGQRLLQAVFSAGFFRVHESGAGGLFPADDLRVSRMIPCSKNTPDVTHSCREVTCLSRRARPCLIAVWRLGESKLTVLKWPLSPTGSDARSRCVRWIGAKTIGVKKCFAIGLDSAYL